MWLNFAKGQMLPITLQTLADYVQQALPQFAALRAADNDLTLYEDTCTKLQALPSTLVDVVQLQSNVRCKYPLQRRHRIGLRMSPEQLEYHQEEMRTRKPHPGSPCPDRALSLSKGSSLQGFDLRRKRTIQS